MKLPTLLAYQEAVQNESTAFVDPTLSGATARRSPLGMPTVASGGFALTFDVTNKGDRFAVRCFHKQGNHLAERYARVAEFVTKSHLNFMVDVSYLDQGIRVEGNVFPLVRMRWIDGIPLNEWVEDNLNAPERLEKVRLQILEAMMALRKSGAAHGDLQHGNILVGKDDVIRLVDYDGMFLPELRQLGPAEQGHRNYQHPARNNNYDNSLDLFASLAIDLSIAGTQHDPTLWKYFHNGDNMLFTAGDFTDPGNSEVVSRLAGIPHLADKTRRLKDACGSEFSEVADILLRESYTTPSARTSYGYPSSRVRGQDTLRADDTQQLRERVGDVVTVSGQVTGTKVTKTQYGNMAFIDFGKYWRGDFTIIAFDRSCTELKKKFGDSLDDLKDAWVSITGLLTAYSGHGRRPTPQIELRRVQSLRLLGAEQVETLMSSGDESAEHDVDTTKAPANTGATGTRPPQPSNKPPPQLSPEPHNRSSAAGGRVDNLDERLGRLYSAPRSGNTQRPGSSNRADPPRPTPPPSGAPNQPTSNSAQNHRRYPAPTPPATSRSPTGAGGGGGTPSPPPASSPTPNHTSAQQPPEPPLLGLLERLKRWIGLR